MRAPAAFRRAASASSSATGSAMCRPSIISQAPTGASDQPSSGPSRPRRLSSRVLSCGSASRRGSGAARAALRAGRSSGRKWPQSSARPRTSLRHLAPVGEAVEHRADRGMLRPEREHRHRQFLLQAFPVVHQVDGGRRAVVLAGAVDAARIEAAQVFALHRLRKVAAGRPGRGRCARAGSPGACCRSCARASARPGSGRTSGRRRAPAPCRCSRTRAASARCRARRASARGCRGRARGGARRARRGRGRRGGSGGGRARVMTSAMSCAIARLE